MDKQKKEAMEEMIKEYGNEIKIKKNMPKIYPVIRHLSFLKEKGTHPMYRNHSPETIIVYGIELPFGYMVITEGQGKEEGITEEELYAQAIHNLSTLDVSYKIDQLGENVFYFFSYEDSYSASRILNSQLMSQMKDKIKGKMGVAIPHQDVLIIADLRDGKGASALSQIAFDFAMQGDTPISPLPFMFEGEMLEPYIAIRHKKSRHLKRD